jgi:hypothetical protein
MWNKICKKQIAKNQKINLTTTIMKRFFFSILVLVATSFFAKSEIITQTIRGTVIDKQTRVTLPGANVVITSSDPVRGTTTNENGNFRLDNVEVGRVSLKFTFIGYQDVVMNNISLQSGKELVLNIYMDELVMAVEEVVITHTADKTSSLNRMATVSSRGFTVEETERYAGSRNDPARMAANFAGVVGVDDSRNDIIIRGNSPMGLLWRLDGVDIPNPNHWGMSGTTGGPVSMLNNTLLENSDFYTGAFPAEYGNAISGVFDLRMRNGNNEQFEFLGQMGFNGIELGAEGPISRKNGSSFLINYRYSFMGIFSALGMDFGTIGVPYYQDLSFKLNFPNTKFGHISIFGLGGLSDIQIWNSLKDSSQVNFYTDEGTDITNGTDMGVVGLSSHYTFSPNTYLKVTFAAMGQNMYTDVDTLSKEMEKFRFYETNMIDNRLSASAILNHRLNSSNTIKGGFTTKMLLSNFHDKVWRKEFDEYRSQIDFNGTTWLIQPYVQWQYRPTDRLTFNSGLHYNLFTFNNSQSIEPRFGVRYGVSPRHSINFGYGLHSQISPLFTYFFQKANTDGTYFKTNPNLGLTKSHQLVVGYDFRINGFSRVKLETYYQNIFDAPVDAVESNSYSMLNNGASFTFAMSEYLANKGTGENYGIEITLEHFLNKGLYFLVTTSLFESKYTGSNGKEFNTAFNNNYVVNGLFGKEFILGKSNPKAKRSLSIDLKTMFAGGKRNTPWTAVLNPATQEYEQQWDYNKAFSVKLADYNKTDLKITYRSNKRGVTQEWGIEITNLMNNDNIQGESFNKYTGKSEKVLQTPMMIIPQWRIIF